MRYFNFKSYHVLITDEANAKLESYIDIAKGEVSGLGTVMEENGVYIIDDVFLFDQVCTGSTTDLDQGKVMEFMTNLLNDGKEDVVNRLRLWWHSHANFSTFWSGTDRYTINSMNADPVWISLVGNKAKKKLVSVDYYNPRISFDDVNLGILETGKDLSKIYSQCKKEVKDKVKELSFFSSDRYKVVDKKEDELNELNEINQLLDSMIEDEKYEVDTNDILEVENDK